MATQLPKSIFIHIPRTGGYWVRIALEEAGVPVNAIVKNIPVFQQEWQLRHHIQHSPLSNIADQSVPTFAFVRHPCSWLQSFWVFQMLSKKRYINKGGPFYSLVDDTFEAFIDNVIRHKPGFISGMYNTYLCDEDRTVDAVGKQETLTEDLIRILRENNEEFDEEVLRSVSPKNCYASLEEWHERSAYKSQELLDRLLDAEFDALERYGYNHSDFTPRIYGSSSPKFHFFSHSKDRRNVGTVGNA